MPLYGERGINSKRKCKCMAGLVSKTAKRQYNSRSTTKLHLNDTLYSCLELDLHVNKYLFFRVALAIERKGLRRRQQCHQLKVNSYS